MPVDFIIQILGSQTQQIKMPVEFIIQILGSQTQQINFQAVAENQL